MDFVEGMVDRRRRGEPLQYVLGIWSFRRLELVVDRRVLIPRPETETVVDVALAELRLLGVGQPLVVDLGTGSGAIAISVALEVPAARVWGTDRSEDALAVARANLSGMGGRVAPRVRLAAGDWFEALPDELRGRVDLVVANPPYVGDDEVLPAEVADWEPAGALFAGPTGPGGGGRHPGGGTGVAAPSGGDRRRAGPSSGRAGRRAGQRRRLHRRRRPPRPHRPPADAGG